MWLKQLNPKRNERKFTKTIKRILSGLFGKDSQFQDSRKMGLEEREAGAASYDGNFKKEGSSLRGASGKKCFNESSLLQQAEPMYNSTKCIRAYNACSTISAFESTH